MVPEEMLAAAGPDPGEHLLAFADRIVEQAAIGAGDRKDEIVVGGHRLNPGSGSPRFPKSLLNLMVRREGQPAARSCRPRQAVAIALPFRESGAMNAHSLRKRSGQRARLAKNTKGPT